MERYIIVERYADNGELSHRALVDSTDGRELGTDGGEPEDQSFWRDWAWVPDELNKAQATVEALQAKVKELENNRVPHSMSHVIELQAMNNRLGAEVEALQAQVKQLEHGLTTQADAADMWYDEFLRIHALNASPEINGICDRALDGIPRTVPVVQENHQLQQQVEALQRELLEWKRALCNLTPDGSEFADDHAYCAEWVREARENQHDIIISKHRELKATQTALDAERQRARTATQLVVETIGATGPEDLESALGRLVAQLDAERGKVRTLERVTQEDVDTIAGLKRDLSQLQALVRALPKCEGWVSVIQAATDEWHIYDGIFTTEESAHAYAALLTHRATLGENS